MGIKDSILKEILKSKNCSFGKYLSFTKILIDNGSETNFYVTPVATAAKKNILIISMLINNNWYEAVQNIGPIIENLKKLYKFNIDNYKLILHCYFEVVQLEKFYLIDPEAQFKLKIMNISDFEKLLN